MVQLKISVLCRNKKKKRKRRRSFLQKFKTHEYLKIIFFFSWIFFRQQRAPRQSSFNININILRIIFFFLPPFAAILYITQTRSLENVPLVTRQSRSRDITTQFIWIFCPNYLSDFIFIYLTILTTTGRQFFFSLLFYSNRTSNIIKWKSKRGGGKLSGS